MQAEWEAEREQRLAELPERFGFIDLASFVRAVRAAAGAGGKRKSRAKDASVVAGKSVAKLAPTKKRQRLEASAKTRPAALPSPAPATEASSAPTIMENVAPPVLPKAAAVSPQAAETWPSGTSLEDPKNFGLRPDRAAQARGSSSRDTFQAKLTKTLHFAMQVLHTSKVSAVVWREWRNFERELQMTRANPFADNLEKRPQTRGTRVSKSTGKTKTQKPIRAA